MMLTFVGKYGLFHTSVFYAALSCSFPSKRIGTWNAALLFVKVNERFFIESVLIVTEKFRLDTPRLRQAGKVQLVKLQGEFARSKVIFPYLSIPT